MAIGMLETNTFDPKNRDRKKTGDSTNYSQFNMNRDLLRRIGMVSNRLNSWSGVKMAALAVKKALAEFGVNGFLNFLRGGYTGWEDGKSYDCAGYRNGIASFIKYFDKYPKLLTDNRRVDINVKHQ